LTGFRSSTRLPTRNVPVATIPQSGLVTEHSLFVPRDKMRHTFRDWYDTTGTGVFLLRVRCRDVLDDVRFASTKFDASTSRSAVQVERDVLFALGFVPTAHQYQPLSSECCHARHGDL
jgi:hypothetical protein